MPQLQKIPFRGTHAFTGFFLKYIEQDPSLKPFFSRFPEPSAFNVQAEEKQKSFPSANRKILVDSLQRQYSKITPVPQPVASNLKSLLQENTFTITTGHQLNIFTGPLYFIYKIITVINATRQLKALHPQYNFVPVYWMASEDHDYEEIKYFRLYGKKYTWETQQQGAVGKFHTKEIQSILQELPGDTSIFQEAYTKNITLADAVRHYVNKLFGDDGLVVIDADDRDLKRIFTTVIHDDIFEHQPNSLVLSTNEKLLDAGYHPTVNPREINFFYLDKSLRSRIEKKGEEFIIVDTDIKFSKKEIEKKIIEEPERFSPNVILRPLYEEMILPNLAYVGGPAELVYWLELKNLFDHYKITFPILLPRNFALIIDSVTSRKIPKTGLEPRDFFEEKNYLFNHWVSKNSSHDLSLGKALKSVEEIYSEITGRCSGIDPTLVTMAKAEAKRVEHSLEKIEKKMLRAEKRLQSDKVRQIEAIKDTLFPNGSLQERTDNFLNFYQQNPDFIRELVKNLDPFDFQFNVLSYHD